MVKGPEHTMGKTDLNKSDCYKKDGKEEGEVTIIYIKQLLQDCSLGPGRTGQDTGHMLKAIIKEETYTPGKEREACAYICIHTKKAFHVKDRERWNQLPGRIYSITALSITSKLLKIGETAACQDELGGTQPCLGSRQADFSRSLPLASAAAQFRHRHQHVGADGQARA